MKKYFTYTILLLGAALLVTSCGKKETEVTAEISDSPATYTADEAVLVREETIIELLAIKNGVKKTISQHKKAESLDSFVRDLESLRPRLEYVRLQTSMLPEKERMVVRGNLAVTTNQLEKELLAMLAKAPGNDDLAVEIANLREKLSPIPLASMVQKY